MVATSNSDDKVRDLRDRLDRETDPVKQADLRQQIADAESGREPGTAQGSQPAQ